MYRYHDITVIDVCEISWCFRFCQVKKSTRSFLLIVKWHGWFANGIISSFSLHAPFNAIWVVTRYQQWQRRSSAVQWISSMREWTSEFITAGTAMTSLLWLSACDFNTGWTRDDLSRYESRPCVCKDKRVYLHSPARRCYSYLIDATTGRTQRSTITHRMHRRTT